MTQPRTWFRWAAALGGSAVLLGAFGAHALKNALSADMLTVWRTAELYQFVHALALLGLALALERQPANRAWQWGAWAFAGGCLLFSGSLYLLAVTGWHWLGAVTPLGGLAFLLGWALVWRGAEKLRR